MKAVRDQNGMGLIEVMVAALVMGVGLLGVLSLQTRSLQLSQQSFYYNQATIHAQDIAERIRANSESGDAYVIDFGENSDADADDCINAECSADELAAWDLKIWKDNLTASLPQGDGAVSKLDEELIVTVRFDDSNGEDSLQSISFALQVQ